MILKKQGAYTAFMDAALQTHSNRQSQKVIFPPDLQSVTITLAIILINLLDKLKTCVSLRPASEKKRLLFERQRR